MIAGSLVQCICSVHLWADISANKHRGEIMRGSRCLVIWRDNTKQGGQVLVLSEGKVGWLHVYYLKELP